MCDVSELLRLPETPKGVVRFYKKGGMYYAINADAEMIAQKHLRSIGSLKDSTSGRGKYVNISDILYASLLKELLLISKKSIELWENDYGKWSKTIEASPGNVAPVIDIINSELDLSEASTLLSISVKESASQIHVYAACCDPTLFTISTTEFVDTASFCSIETLLTQTLPNEVLLSMIPSEYQKKLKTIVEKFSIPYRFVEKPEPVEMGDFPNNKAVKCLLSSLRINTSEFTHNPFLLTDFMTIDYSALAAMNVFPEGKTSSSGVPTSLYQMLNICVTPMGSRLLHQFMQQPLVDKKKLEERLDYVEGMVNSPQTHLAIREALKAVPDVARLLRKFINSKASLQDCVKLHDVAVVCQRFVDIADIACEEVQPIISRIVEHCDNMRKVSSLVKKTIDFSLIPQHIFRVSPEFDDLLTETSEQIEEIKMSMERVRDKIARDTGIDSEKMKVERATNLKSFFFRVPRQLERDLRGEEGITILETRKDGVHFTNRELNKLAEKIILLEGDYADKQKQIARRLVETLAEYESVFQTVSEAFAYLDVYSAFAVVSSNNIFIRPIISNDKFDELKLVQARHPLVEKHVTFIPNDIDMKKGDSSFMIISGPNSAGKSTLLKTVAICVYMAHIGCFVPCTDATIPLTHSIHARVGAWDSVNMSTFTVEMTEMATILQTANERSIIIIDELGRSTSVSDGFGLAWSISKYLAHKVQAFTLFATHFHELCNLEKEIPCVCNYHMDATADEGLIMRYKLLPGSFPNSFGIIAAEKAGFLPHVLERAKEKERELEAADNSFM